MVPRFTAEASGFPVKLVQLTLRLEQGVTEVVAVYWALDFQELLQL